MIIYSEVERVRILTGCGITLEQIIQYESLTFTGYEGEWKKKTAEKLKEWGCPVIIILRILNGEYDHNKEKLHTHLKLFNHDSLTNKIWTLIK